MTRVTRSSRPSGRGTLDLSFFLSLSLSYGCFSHQNILPRTTSPRRIFSTWITISFSVTGEEGGSPFLHDSACMFIFPYLRMEHLQHCVQFFKKISYLILVIFLALLSSKQNREIPNSKWHLPWRNGRRNSISLLNIPIWRDALDPTSAGTTCIKRRKAISLFPIGIPAMWLIPLLSLPIQLWVRLSIHRGEIIIFLSFLSCSNKRNARWDALKPRDRSSAEVWNDKHAGYIARMQRHAAYHLKHESFPRVQCKHGLKFLWGGTERDETGLGYETRDNVPKRET